MARIILVANRGFGIASSRLPVISRLCAAGHQVWAAAATDETVDRIVAAGAQFVDVPFQRGGFKPGDTAAFMALRALYRRVRPDLIVHYNGKPVIYGTAAAPRSSRIVNTITGFGNLLNGRIGRVVHSMLRRAAQRSHAFVFQNHDDLAYATSSGMVPADRARVVVSSGVRTDLFQPSEQPHTGALKILFVGRLLWQKGVREYVEAAGRLRVRFTDVDFLLGGEFDEGHADAVPRAWVDEHARAGTVEFIGYVHDMPDRLRASDIFVLPSVYREGVPRVLLEAAACGLPVVTIDGPGCREAVRHEETGFLIPPGDVNALEQRLGELIADPQLRARMGQRAREFAVAHFDQERIIAQLLEIYQGALAAPADARSLAVRA